MMRRILPIPLCLPVPVLTARSVSRRPAWTSVRCRLRSGEHTSELQSPCNLVCRLLLEKKKRIISAAHTLASRYIVHTNTDDGSVATTYTNYLSQSRVAAFTSIRSRLRVDRCSKSPYL